MLLYFIAVVFMPIWIRFLLFSVSFRYGLGFGPCAAGRFPGKKVDSHGDFIHANLAGKRDFACSFTVEYVDGQRFNRAVLKWGCTIQVIRAGRYIGMSAEKIGRTPSFNC